MGEYARASRLGVLFVVASLLAMCKPSGSSTEAIDVTSSAIATNGATAKTSDAVTSNRSTPIDVGALGKSRARPFAPTAGGFDATSAGHRAHVDADGSIAFSLREASDAALSLRTVSIARGRGDAAPLVSGHAVLAAAGEVEIDRGAAMESIATRPHGIEQSWAFATKPAGKGDFVARVHAAGMDVVASTASGVHFAHPGTHGGARYGMPTWIDAHGDRTACALTYDAARGDLVVRVPAAAVEGAAYPATLDPTVSAETAVDAPVYAAESSEGNPVVSSDGTNFIMVWWDTRETTGAPNNSVAIWATRLSASGQILDPGGIALGNSYEANPAVAFNGTDYVVAWTQATSATSEQVVATRVSTSGVVRDTPRIVLSDPATLNEGVYFSLRCPSSTCFVSAGARVHPLNADGTTPASFVLDAHGSAPDVVFDGTNFTFAWSTGMAVSGTDNFTSQVVAARRTPGGTILDATPFALAPLITSAYGNTYYSSPTLAFDGTNSLAVFEEATSSFSGTTHTTYGARFSPQGSTLGSMFAISSTLDVSTELFVNGSTMILGGSCTSSACGSGVYMRRVSPSGVVLDAQDVQLPNPTPDVDALSAAANASNLLLAYNYYCGNCTVEPAVVEFLTLGAAASGGPFSAASISNTETVPATSFDGTNHLVAWVDTRGGATTNVYETAIDPTGNEIGANATALSNSTTLVSHAPAVTFGGSNYLSTWETDAVCCTSSGGFSICPAEICPTYVYSALVRADGTLLGTPIEVPTAGGSTTPVQTAPAAAFDGTRYLVVFADGSAPEIYGAFLDTTGAVVGSRFLVSIGARSPSHPAVAFAGTTYLVVWQDGRNSSGTGGGAYQDIYGARVDTGGNVLDANGVAISLAILNQETPAVASDGTNFMVAWADGRNDPLTDDIYASRVTSNGDVLDPSGILVSNGTDAPLSHTDQSAPTIAYANDGMNYLVAWQDNRTGPYAIEGAFVRNDGTVLDPSGIPLTDGTDVQITPSAAPSGVGKVFVAYVHLDTSTGFGVNRVRVRYVDSGVANGTACSADDSSACASRFCVDGVCCATSCDGSCQTCGATPGTCTSVVSAEDPDTCSVSRNESRCDANGACKLTDGQSTASAAACLSGFVSQGVCCDQACTGGCSTCTATPGTCTPLAAENPGVDSVCTADGGPGILCDGVGLTCPGTCARDTDCPSTEFCNAHGSCQPQLVQGSACNLATDCATAGTCTPCASGELCEEQSCDGATGTVTVAVTKSGAGACLPQANTGQKSCGGFGCDGANCKTSCTTSADCASSYTCDVALKRCVTSAVCAGPHTATDVNGNTNECAPYICSAGACAHACTTVDDCVGGFICSTEMTCVAAGTSASSASNGCSCGVAEGRGDTGFGGSLAALVATLLVRRRRSRRAAHATSR